jgi:hypothetical protein
MAREAPLARRIAPHDAVRRLFSRLRRAAARGLHGLYLGGHPEVAARPTPVAEPPYPHLEALIGREATTLTTLTPGGFIDVNGARESAVSDDGFIDAGTPVVIVALRQSNLVVRRR